MFLFKRGNIYQFQYFDQHSEKNKRVSTGESTKSLAMVFVSKFQKEISKKNIPQIITLDEFEKEYFEFAKVSFTKSYQKSVVVAFRMFREFFGNPPIQKITQNDVEKFLITTQKRSLTVAHLYYRTLKASFNKGLFWGYIKVNPFQKIKLPKVAKKYPVFINQNEFNKLVEVVRDQVIKDIFTTAYYTGLRQSEILNLKWTSIDFIRQEILVKNTNDFITKSKKERVIPMNNYLLEILQRRYENCKSEFVFSTNNNYKFNEDYISHKFKKEIRKAKLSESYKFHTLRHSFASNLVQRGVSLYIVKELLGHQDISTTQIYSHLNNTSLKNAIDLL
ncbi:MAG: tyrosine-type recombinase/integrase [Melioribacteraceae bacterium]